MGRLIITRAQTARSLRQRTYGLGILTFSFLVVICGLTRIFQSLAVIYSGGCSQLEQSLFGSHRSLDGPLDFVFAISLLAALFLLSKAISDYVSKVYTTGRVLLDIASALMIALTASATILHWAYFNPANPTADFINKSVAKNFAPSAYFLRFEDEADYDPFKNTAGWDKIDVGHYHNDDLEITAKYERLNACFSADFVRYHLNNYYPDGFLPSGESILSLSDRRLEQHTYDFVLYDSEGYYLTSMQPFDHDTYPRMAQLDRERNLRRPNLSPWEAMSAAWRVNEQVSDAYEAELRQQEIERNRPLTREEIEENTKRKWEQYSLAPE